MPILKDDTMEDLKTGSNYGFSAVKIDELGAPEYTLVTITQDASSSVSGYAREMENCLKTILESCQKSPRAENLMLRLLSFNNGLNEIHGFRLLNTITPNDYTDILNPYGGTALFDATQSAIEATKDYGEILYDQDFGVNAIVFIVTDGDDNSSRATANSVKSAVEDALKTEKLESLTVVLVGVGEDSYVQAYLDEFKQDANITQFVNIGDATPNKLAKLANFISRSISSTSQALADGTDASSNLLTF
jgi:uncharacterized protein YegL